MIVRGDVRTASWAGGRALRGLARDRVEGAERAGVAYAGRRFSLVYLSVPVEVYSAHEGRRMSVSGNEKPDTEKEQCPSH